MRRRMRNVALTPRILWQTAKALAGLSRKLMRSTRALAALLVLLLLLLFWLLLLSREALLPRLAKRDFAAGNYVEAAETYLSLAGNRGRFNAANAYYRSGEYEKALQLYEQVRSGDSAFKAAVYFNAANALIRLKEYEKAREMFRRSLALRNDPEALENLLHLLGAEAQDHMLTGRQEGKKRAQEQEASSPRQENGKRKEGGGSDRPMQAEQSRGGGAQGKRTEQEEQLDFSDKGQRRLSSKQYDLINRRSVNETKPW